MLVFFETAHHCNFLFACLLASRQTAGKQASTAFAGKSDEQIYCNRDESMRYCEWKGAIQARERVCVINE